MEKHNLEKGDKVIVTDINGNTHNLYVHWVPNIDNQQIWKFRDNLTGDYRVYFFTQFSHIMIVEKHKE